MSRPSLLSSASFVALGSVALSLATAGSAGAAVPGLNGRLAYSVAPEDKSRTDDIPGVAAIESVLPDGSSRTVLASAKSGDRQGAEYSPDGKRIAWLSAGRKSEKADGLYVAASDGTGARRVAKTSWTEDVAWSPDGTTLVYSDITDGVYSVRADGSSRPVKLVETPDDGGWYRRPTFSPDGSTIVLEHATVGNGNPGRVVSAVLMRIDPDGSNLARVFPASVVPRLSGEPDFSPDGKSIVFDGQRPGDGDRWSIYIAPLDGSAVRTLFTSRRGDWVDGPTWSPDGTTIAFATGGKPKQGASLRTLAVETNKVTVIRRVRTGAISKPTWQPLPR